MCAHEILVARILGGGRFQYDQRNLRKEGVKKNCEKVVRLTAWVDQSGQVNVKIS